MLRKLILVEPGGELDRSLDPAAALGPSARASRIAVAAGKISGGDIDRGLAVFFDMIEGEGAWARLPAAPKQQLRDNAFTLIGQGDENRQPAPGSAMSCAGAPQDGFVAENTIA